jgi:hypothetical protein
MSGQPENGDRLVAAAFVRRPHSWSRPPSPRPLLLARRMLTDRGFDRMLALGYRFAR